MSALPFASTDGSSVFEILSSVGTVGAVVVALFAARMGLASQRRTLRAEGRRQTAMAIATWLQEAVDLIERWHNPETYAKASPSNPQGLFFAANDALESSDGDDVEPPLHDEYLLDHYELTWRARLAERLARIQDWLGDLRLKGPALREPRMMNESPEPEPMSVSHGYMAPRIDAVVDRFSSIRGQARLAFGPDHEVTRLVNDAIEAITRARDHGAIGGDGYRPEVYVSQTLIPIANNVLEALAEACELREGEPSPRRRIDPAAHALYGAKTRALAPTCLSAREEAHRVSDAA